MKIIKRKKQITVSMIEINGVEYTANYLEGVLWDTVNEDRNTNDAIKALPDTIAEFLAERGYFKYSSQYGYRLNPDARKAYEQFVKKISDFVNNRKSVKCTKIDSKTNAMDLTFRHYPNGMPPKKAWLVTPLKKGKSIDQSLVQYQHLCKDVIPAVEKWIKEVKKNDSCFRHPWSKNTEKELNGFRVVRYPRFDNKILSGLLKDKAEEIFNRQCKESK